VADVAGDRFAATHATYFFAAVTFVLGAVFLCSRDPRVAGMIAIGRPRNAARSCPRSSLLSACHGLHVPPD